MTPTAGQRYLSGAVAILVGIADDQWPAIRTAAEMVAETVAGGGLVHAFGTGHSHMLAEELFYRAGGLAAVNPILVESLMLHTGAERSTDLERRPGIIAEVLDDVPLRAGDTLIVASNSGGNAACEEMAQLANAAGAGVVAIVSMLHAQQVGRPRARGRLVDLADVVIDNHGAAGDASVTIEGLEAPVAPTSTVAGAAIVNAIVAESVEILTSSRGRRRYLRQQQPGRGHRRQLRVGGSLSGAGEGAVTVTVHWLSVPPEIGRESLDQIARQTGLTPHLAPPADLAVGGGLLHRGDQLLYDPVHRRCTDESYRPRRRAVPAEPIRVTVSGTRSLRWALVDLTDRVRSSSWDTWRAALRPVLRRARHHRGLLRAAVER